MRWWGSSLSPHSGKVVGTIPRPWGLSGWSLHTLNVSTCVLFGFSSFLLIATTSHWLDKSFEIWATDHFTWSWPRLWHDTVIICSAVQWSSGNVKMYSFIFIVSETTWPTELFGRTVWRHQTWCPGIFLCSLCCWSRVWSRWLCALCRWWTACWELCVVTAVATVKM